MKVFTLFTKPHFRFVLLVFLLLQVTHGFAQTNYWVGSTNSDWGVGSNWSTGIVPGSSDEVVIGSTHFTGSNQPIMNETAVVTVRRITLTNESGKNAKLFITNNYNLVVTDLLTIGAGTTLENEGSDMVVQGSIINNGSYLESEFIKNNGRKGRFYPSLEMSGTGTISGAVSMIISHLKITGSVTLAQNITIRTRNITVSGQNTAPTSDLTVAASGTFDPKTFKVTFNGKGTVASDGTNSLVVEGGGTLKVMATTYSGNYTIQPTALYATSIIDYAATSGTQTVLARAYGILKISGGGMKELEATTTVSDIAATTQLLVEAGTLDLKTFTLNRTGATTPIAGGTLTVANGATLRIGGTNTMPTGYQSRNFGSTSTVEYYGQAQTVSQELYGNLHLTCEETTYQTKTMPAAAMTISGSLKGSKFAKFTALNNLTINGDVVLSDNASFIGGTGLTHTVGGNWTNNADFTGSTSTVVLNGTSKSITRSIVTSSTLKNEFNNLTIAGSGTKITLSPAGTTLTVNGNLSTTGAGTLLQSAESLTMAGAAGSISGTGIVLNDVVIKGAGVTSTASFTVNGNFTSDAGASFNATAGTITMGGDGKSITANGTTAFFGLRILGSSSTSTTFTRTSSSFSINSDLSGNYLDATGGTITFGGATATIAGTHNLYTVTVTGTTRRMVANANLGIRDKLTVSGTLDVTTNVPNTITYNGTTAQPILGRAYNNIVFANAGAKTADGALTVNGDITISSGSNFNASTFDHQINGNWSNSGTFNASTGTVTFAGTSDATVSGTTNTTFNILTLGKSAATNNITLSTSATTRILNLTTGWLRTTGTNSITVTENRSGNGWVVGTITRQHTFNSTTDYAFAGPYNLIKFANASGVTSVTVKNSLSEVSSFTDGSAINRQYDVSILPTGTYDGEMQLQYDDADLNGNTEANLKVYQDVASNGTWADRTFSTRETTLNWVRQIGLSNLSGSWTLSSSAGFKKWTGASTVDNLWTTAGNWYNNQIPTNSDIAVLGELGSGTIQQPEIRSTVDVQSIQFKGNNAITLTMGAGGALTVQGNIGASGLGISGAKQHYIVTNDKSITVNGNLILSNGSSNNVIDLTIGTGTLSVAGSITQNTGSDIALTGNGSLKIQGDYNNNSTAASSFTASNTGTVTYEGTNAQVIAAVPYHNLTIAKPSGAATLTSASALTLTGNLSVSGAGTATLALPTLNVDGKVDVTAGTLNAGGSTLFVKGNWNVAGGTFVPGTSTVNFTGSNAQTISASTFNNLTVSKTAGTLTAAGNVIVNAGLTISGGTVNLGTYTMNRSAVGGTFTLANGAELQLGGSNNFPANFNTYTLGATSTVHYNGSVAQTVAPVTYGLLTFSNGDTNKKLLTASTTVVGDLTINSGATVDANSQTLTISGNFTNSGSFSPGAYTSSVAPSGTLVLASTGGVAKSITGALTINNFIIQPAAYYALTNSLTVNGSIDIVGTGLVYVDPYATTPVPDLTNNGTLDAGAAVVSVAGDFKNSGILMSRGSATFLGVRHQTIQLLAPILPSNKQNPTVVFDGTVSPTLNSTRSPQFATVYIKNTGGVTASVGWTIGGQFIITTGASFHGGPYTHTFYTTFENQGYFTSSGLIDFKPPYPGVILDGHPFYFGTDAAKFQSTGTLRLAGTKQILLAGTVPATLNNLVIANSVGISNTTLNAAYPLAGTSWNLTGGLTVESGGVLNGIPGTTFTIAEDLVNNGSIVSINPANGTAYGSGANFVFTGTEADITGLGVSVMGNLTFDTGSNVNVRKELNIYGNLTHNGSSLNTSGVNLKLVGAASTLINGTAGSLSLENVIIAKSNASVTLGANITDTNTLTLASGTLDVGAYSVTKPTVLDESQTLVFSNLTVANGTTLKVGGPSNFPQLDEFYLGESSTVIYNGATQAVKSIQYGNLSLLNTATATFSTGTALIAGDLVIGRETTQVIVTPETIEYNGSGAQTVAALNYKNLTLSNAGTKTLATGTVGVSGALTKSGTAEVDANNVGVTVDYNGVDPQSVLSADYYNLSLSNTGVKSFSGTTGIANVFNVASAGIADLNAVGNVVNFNGTVAQGIPGLNYKNLKVSGAGDKTLQAAASAAESVIMGTGIIKTGSHILTLDNTASLVGETNDSYIHGKVVTARTFGATSGNAVATTQGIAPQGITATSSDFGNIGIQVSTTNDLGTVTVTRETGFPITSPTSTNQSIARNFTFSVTGANSNLDASVVFKYLDWELNGLQEPDLRLSSFEDGKWIKQSTAAPDAATNTIGASVKTLTRITLGSIVAPLPVELLSFTAKKNGNNAELKWATASEKNNAGFEVQVSTDGYTYQQIGYVESKVGSSSLKQEYSFTDTRNGKSGMQYYRLKQIDLDGVSKLYGPKAVDFGVIVKATPAQVYPNPFNDKLRLSLSTPEAGMASVKLYTSTGKLLKTLPLQVQAGLNDTPLQLAQAAYEPGLYLLVIELNGQQQTIKLMKE